MTSPWAVVLCQFSDTTTPPPFSRQRFEELLTNSGAGKFNMVDFFRDMSHGSLDLTATRLLGWYSLKQKFSDFPPAHRDDVIAWGRQAALDAHEDLAPYGNRILVITHPATDLFGGGSGAVSGDGRDSSGMSSLSPSLLGQEMGHVYGLNHSWFGSTEYGDRWDIMSTRNSSMAAHPFFTDLDVSGRPIFRVGPGLNAANMFGRGWLDMLRVWQATREEYATVVELRPLHRRDLPGYLCARVGPYFFEFRVDEGWDAGIQAPAVLVHEFDFNRSNLLTATNGNDYLQKGDQFVRGNAHEPTSQTGLVQVKVVDIDRASRVATLEVTQRPDSRPVAGPGRVVVGVDDDGGGLIVIGGKVVKIPPRSPVYAVVEELAQLQQAGSLVDAAARDVVHRNSIRAVASLMNDELSRMESPCVPFSTREVLTEAQISASLARSAESVDS
ncbi:hypothetical protein ACWEO2_02515 [Nocardia sp. NPDC004278]